MSKTKIVIYSQRPHMGRLITEIIGHHNAHIVCCTTIPQTIDACQSENPSLVIILETTPFFNGSHIISQIRSTHSRTPSIYVISWQQSEQTVLSLLECGVNQYMTFPICMSRLLSKIPMGSDDSAYILS